MTIAATIDANFPREVAFLKALVRAPSDNPPGDCAPAAEVAAQELQALGFSVERHRVPDAVVRANGMVSATNLVVRRTFGVGAGPVIALNAHGDVVPPGEGWTVDPYGAVERDNGSGADAERAAHDEIGGTHDAAGAHNCIGHAMTLDGETKRL